MEYDPGFDVFSLNKGMIVNPVNCKGVMGAGLALQFKKRYPHVFDAYRRVCEKGLMKPGSVQLVGIDEAGKRVPSNSREAKLIVANVATKDHWKNPSRLEWVDEALGKLAAKCEEMGIERIAIPKLGCGLGGLDWKDVRKSVENHFRPLSEKGTTKVIVCGEAQKEAKKSSLEKEAGNDVRPNPEVRHAKTKNEEEERASEPIAGFQGEFRWLSNFYSLPVEMDGMVFPTVEHAYQAAKTESIDERRTIAGLNGASAAKKYGKTLKLRHDWESRKISVMEDLVRQKFNKDPFKSLLLSTGDREIVELNTWGDSFWGMIKNRNGEMVGENHLGRLIMAERERIRSKEAARDGQEKEASDRKPRVLNKHRDQIPQDAVYIGRGSPWENPFSHKEGTKAKFIVANREEAVKRFEEEVLPQLDIEPLRGKDLVCFCAPLACHGHAIMRALEKDPKTRRHPVYAGIGARKTPPEVLRKMKDIAEILAGNGFVLRSGAAMGADSAFEEGCDRAKGKKEIFLPWKGFSGRSEDGRRVFVTGDDKDAMALARLFHPAWENLSRGAKSLMARNSHQIFGRQMNDRADLVICWTEGGVKKGGTGMALRMAENFGVKEINLGSEAFKDKTADQIAEIAIMIANGKPANDLVEKTSAEKKRKREVFTDEVFMSI